MADQPVQPPDDAEGPPSHSPTPPIDRSESPQKDPSATPPGEAETTFSTLPVLNGLKLMLHPHGSIVKAFTYALTPLTEDINPVKNKMIVTDEVQGDHVILHRLEPAGDLAEVVAGHRMNNLTKAVVIMNTSNSYMLKSSHLERLQKSNFPLLVVTITDGLNLLDILNESENVFCDIDVESTVDPIYQPPPNTQQMSAETVPEEKSTSGKGFWPFGGKGKDKDRGLKAELKKYVFPDSDTEPVAVSEIGARFMMAMSAFHNYERQGKDPKQVKDALHKLRDHLGTMFIVDFPFYIVVAHRIYMKESHYRREERDPFIISCINAMESGEAQDISTTLNNFLKRGFLLTQN